MPFDFVSGGMSEGGEKRGFDQEAEHQKEKRRQLKFRHTANYTPLIVRGQTFYGGDEK